MVLECSAGYDRGGNFAARARFDAKLEVAVVEHDSVAGVYVVGEILVLGGDQSGFAHDIAGRDRDGLAGFELDLAPGEGSRANLGPRQVGQHADGFSEFFGDAAHDREGGAVGVVVSVREVQAKDVDTGLHQVADRLFVIGTGS